MFIHFFLFLSLCAGIAYSEEYSLQNQIKQIDIQVDFLDKKKVDLKKKASRHLDRAHHWQFNSEMSLDCRREYEAASQGADKIALITLQIEGLKKEKKDLLER